MRTIDKYLTESKVALTRSAIRKIIEKPTGGHYEIDDKKVVIQKVDDTMIWKYPSSFAELTYILIDMADELGHKYQQIGMNTKKEMKFIVDLG